MLSPFAFTPIPDTAPVAPTGPINWSDLKGRIVAGLDVVHEFELLGVETTGKVLGDKHECFGFGREKTATSVPSGVIFAKSGIYKDSGSGDKPIHLVEFALKHAPTRFARWIDALKHYAALANVEVGTVRAKSGGRYNEKEYTYADRDGTPRYKVFRDILPNGEKKFTQHPVNTRGEVIPGRNMDGVTPLPYRFGELPCGNSGDANEDAESDSSFSSYCFLTEGEKAADSLVAIGLTASTAHGGAGSAAKYWPVIASHFRGLDCVFLPDNDATGRKVAAIACKSLRDAGAASVRCLALPGLPVKGDAVEWIADGGTAEQLQALADACPLWSPEMAEATATSGDPPGLPDDFPADADVELIMMDTVQPVAVRWLWYGVIPLGKLTQFGGEPKMGKSFLTTWLAAAVTTGGEIPGGQGKCMPQGSVILLSAEDDRADTIRPRLDACGADCSKVGVINTVRGKDNKFLPFTLAYIAHLERAVIRLGDVKLVIIDPITHYATAGFDDHKTTQVRQLLEPLRGLAEKYDLAVVFVHHFNKGNGTKALNRFSGSGAYGALARSNWVVIRDADNPDRRLFLSAGCNLVREPNGLAYRIDPESMRVVFEDAPLTITADDALAASMERREDAAKPAKINKVKLAEDWLAAQFIDRIPILSDLIFERAEPHGFSRSSLFAAKKNLGIQAKKQSGPDGQFIWLPPPEQVVVPFPGTGLEPTGP